MGDRCRASMHPLSGSVVAGPGESDAPGHHGHRREPGRDHHALVERCQAYKAIEQPSVSLHLRVLRDAGLLVFREQGAAHIYTVCPDALRIAIQIIEEILTEAKKEGETNANIELARRCREETQ
ncbi:MAG: helix-turn-helix transcriptional regulator [Ktedonobacteraceae bacterium]|nr:helix-turn-helix transcriptional regulator [Ktedonobacteraceae bacterium]